MQCSTKAMLGFLAVTAAGALSRPTMAHATPIIQARCTLDSMDQVGAKMRIEWARACGTKINVVSPTNPTPPASAFLTGATSFNGIPLVDYLETNDPQGRNSYSGDVATVNQVFLQSQYRVGPITATTLPDGFQKWTEPSTFLLKAFLYPTFGNNADINAAVQLFPNPNYSLVDCSLYADTAATRRVDTSITGFFVNGYCPGSGCYTPDQQISFASGDEPILSAFDALRTGVTTLTPHSTLEHIKLKTDDVASYMRDLHDATQVIFDIRTRSGGELHVTDKHPVLVDDGRMVEARTLKAGTKLVKADGSRDPIVSVTQTSYFGKVYNLKPTATNRVANIIIAQGFLVGSSRFQNEDVDYINRIILGRSIPRSVVPR